MNPKERPRTDIRALTWNLFHGRDHPPGAELYTWRARFLRRTERNAIHAQVNRRLLDEFYAANRTRLGAPVGGSDCHFGAHDMASAVTEYDGDFKTAVQSRATRGRRLRQAGPAPAGMAVRQQWRSLVQLPLRRLRGQL